LKYYDCGTLLHSFIDYIFQLIFLGRALNVSRYKGCGHQSDLENAVLVASKYATVIHRLVDVHVAVLTADRQETTIYTVINTAIDLQPLPVSAAFPSLPIHCH